MLYFLSIRHYNECMTIVDTHQSQLSRLTLPLHHAYCVVGEAREAISRITDFLKSALDFEAAGNLDFWQGEYETLGIDEARFLSEASTRRALGARKVFIIAARIFTDEAQNALLKTIEEPSPDTHLFLIVSSPEVLLSTVRSRLQIVFADNDAAVDELLAAARFLALSIPARLALAQGMLKELENEKKEKEDKAEPLLSKGRILRFLDALEKTLAKDTRANRAALSEILEVRKYAHDRAPSLKLLLEHLALVLPKM